MKKNKKQMDDKTEIGVVVWWWESILYSKYHCKGGGGGGAILSGLVMSLDDGMGLLKHL